MSSWEYKRTFVDCINMLDDSCTPQRTKMSCWVMTRWFWTQLGVSAAHILVNPTSTVKQILFMQTGTTNFSQSQSLKSKILSNLQHHLLRWVTVCIYLTLHVYLINSNLCSQFYFLKPLKMCAVQSYIPWKKNSSKKSLKAQIIMTFMPTTSVCKRRNSSVSVM